MKDARRLRLELAPSAGLAAAIMALHAIAAGSVAAVLPGAAGGLLAAALLALGAAAAWGRGLLRSPASVRAMEISESGVVLELAGGARIDAQPAERRYVSRYLVTVPVRRPMRRTILVTGDMLGRDSFRALRIWALWGKLPPVAGKQLAA